MKIFFTVKNGVVIDVKEWDELVIPIESLTNMGLKEYGIWYKYPEEPSYTIYYIDLDFLITIKKYEIWLDRYINEAITMRRDQIIMNLYEL